MRRTWHLELALQVQAEYSLVGTYQRDQSLTEGSEDTGSISKSSGLLIFTDSVLIAMLHRATCGQPKTARKCHAYSNVQLHDPCTVLPNPGALRRHEVTLMVPVSLTCLCSAALRMPSAPTRELRR